MFQKLFNKGLTQTSGPDGPEVLNNVKIGQDQLQLIMKRICFMGVAAILVSDLKQFNEHSIKQPSDF